MPRGEVGPCRGLVVDGRSDGVVEIGREGRGEDGNMDLEAKLNGCGVSHSHFVNGEPGNSRIEDLMYGSWISDA